VIADQSWLDAETACAAGKAAQRELEVVGRRANPFGIVNALFEHARYVSMCMGFTPALAHRYCCLRAHQIARHAVWPINSATFVAESVELLTQLSTPGETA